MGEEDLLLHNIEAARDEEGKQMLKNEDFIEVLDNHRFKPIQFLDAGGNNYVFKVLDTQSDEYRIIRLSIKKSDDKEDLNDLASIDKKIGKVSHPNIIKTHPGFFIKLDEKYHWLGVQDFFEGETLASAFSTLQDDPLEIRIEIAKQLTSALLELGKNHLSHNDLHSKNVLLNKDHRLMIIDPDLSISTAEMQTNDVESLKSIINGSLLFDSDDIDDFKKEIEETDSISHIHAIIDDKNSELFGESVKEAETSKELILEKGEIDIQPVEALFRNTRIHTVIKDNLLNGNQIPAFGTNTQFIARSNSLAPEKRLSNNMRNYLELLRKFDESLNDLYILDYHNPIRRGQFDSDFGINDENYENVQDEFDKIRHDILLKLRDIERDYTNSIEHQTGIEKDIFTSRNRLRSMGKANPSWYIILFYKRKTIDALEYMDSTFDASGEREEDLKINMSNLIESLKDDNMERFYGILKYYLDTEPQIDLLGSLNFDKVAHTAYKLEITQGTFIIYLKRKSTNHSYYRDNSRGINYEPMGDNSEDAERVKTELIAYFEDKLSVLIN